MALLVTLLTKFTRISIDGKIDVTICIKTIKLSSQSFPEEYLLLALGCAFLHTGLITACLTLMVLSFIAVVIMIACL